MSKKLRMAAFATAFVLLFQGCATIAGTVTAPAAVITCPVQVAASEMSMGKKVLLILATPLMVPGIILSGLMFGVMQDIKALGDKGYKAEDVFMVATCGK